MKQISLFKNDSNLLYLLFDLNNKNKQIMPLVNASKYIFDMLNNNNNVNHTNVRHLLLFVNWLSTDLHEELYILNCLYLNKIKQNIIELNYDSGVIYILKLFEDNINIEPHTIVYIVSQINIKIMNISWI